MSDPTAQTGSYEVPVRRVPATRREARRAKGKRSRAPRRGGLLGFLREIAIVLLAALVLSWVVKTFLLQPFWIPSGSMKDTLDVGDRIMVSKLTPTPFDIKRGDIVVFKDPGGWLEGAPPAQPQKFGPDWLQSSLEFVGLAPSTAENHLVKRVIGLPGDHVEGKPGEPIRVNGQPIDEPYVNEDSMPTGKAFDIVVPEGRVWVMGDHRGASGDSRFHDDGTGATGSVPVSDVVGRAVLLVWPLDHGTWLDDHDEVFEKVPAPPAS